MQKRTKFFFTAVLGLLIAIIGQIAGPSTAVGQTAGSSTATCNANFVIPVGETYGSTYGEWSARWWQWLLSIPTATNPNLGGDCTQGQFDDVWFLPGTFGGTLTYKCTIPAGKPMFVPLINNLGFNPTGPDTLLSLRQLAAGLIDGVKQLEVSINGKELTKDDLARWRVRSPAFSLILPPDQEFLIPSDQVEKADSLVSDGYWMLLNPLKKGQRITITVRVHAQAPGTVFDASTTYILTGK